MGYLCEGKGDALLPAEFPEGCRVKLFTVVGDNDLMDTKAADDVFPDEGLYLLGSDGLEGLGLRPLGGIIGGDYYVLHTAGTLRHGLN